MFQWGILSTAKIGREKVIPALLNSASGQVAAIASRDPSRAAEIAKRFQIPTIHDSYDALLDDPAIDGVYIPLPTSDHVDWSVRAAAAGKHVLCEKPISLRAEQIKHLEAASKASGKLISEAFMVHFHPQWTKVRALLFEGAIGTLRHVEGAFTYFNMDPKNMRNQVALGGGGLLDIGVYPSFTTRNATGAEPQRIRAEVTRDPNFGTDIYANVTADFGAFTLTFYCSTQMALHQRMVFHGDQGRIEVPAPFNPPGYDMARVILRRADRGEEVFTFGEVDQYALQADGFVAATKDRDARHVTLANSAANQRMIDAIFAAGDSGGWVEV